MTARPSLRNCGRAVPVLPCSRPQPPLSPSPPFCSSASQCVNTLLSTFWWMDNVVYWVNYGCQRVQDGKPQWVKPCPADAMCSWIKQISADENGSTEFCAERAEYIKPQ